LSESQIRELVEWADATPGANEGPVLLEKLRSLGVQCGLNAAYTFREKRITPALDMIRSARLFAEQLGTELSADQANIAHGSNMVAQQMVFDWMVESKRKGVSLDDPETAKHFKRLFAIVAEGMNAKDRSTLTEARVRKLETELAEYKAAEEQRKAAMDKLTKTDGRGMTLEARNAVRRELGLSPLTAEAA
jgi:hypothetical protein